MFAQRKTINTNVSISGIGLHSGIYTTVEIHPAAAGSGIVFVRSDLKGLRIPALQASTTALEYATTVGKDDVQIGTVEHLLSALMACGITDVDIHIDGPEVPIIDGSALPFMHLIDAAGVRELGAEIPVLRLREPVELVEGDKSIRSSAASRSTSTSATTASSARSPRPVRSASCATWRSSAPPAWPAAVRWRTRSSSMTAA